MDLAVQPWIAQMRAMRPLPTQKPTHFVPNHRAEVTWNDLDKIGATSHEEPSSAWSFTTALALMTAGIAVGLLTLVFGSVVAGGTWLALDGQDQQPSMQSTAK